MELFKACVQNKRGLLFSFFSSVINILRGKRVFIIIQYCRPNVILQKCVFKAIRKLLFSLLSYFSNT